MTKPQRSNFIPRCLPKTAKGTSPVVATGFRPDLHLGFFTGFTCSNFPWKQKYQKHPKPPITLLRVIPTLKYIWYYLLTFYSGFEVYSNTTLVASTLPLHQSSAVSRSTVSYQHNLRVTAYVDTYIYVCIYINRNIYIHIYIWRFPKIGLPLNHPFLDGIFHQKNHPFGGTPHLWKAPYPLRSSPSPNDGPWARQCHWNMSYATLFKID